MNTQHERDERSGLNLCIVGATGMVGEAMLAVLEAHSLPINHLYVLASARSAGKTIHFRGEAYTVCDLATFDFAKADVGLFSAGAIISAEYAPKAAAAGCVVIDNTSHFRQAPDVPLVVAEVNPSALRHIPRNIIANPNCSTMQMMVALKPIYDAVGIRRIDVATYQAVSGSGKAAVDALAAESTEALKGEAVQPSVYAHPIGFNCIPHIDVWQENGFSKEEMKMVWETRKILADDTIGINPTAVRVPVFTGHSEAIHLETARPISPNDARALLGAAPGVKVVDDLTANAYPTAHTAAGNDWVWVGRIRENLNHANGLSLWVVSDNVRKGAATNTVQIAEALLAQGYFSARAGS